MPVGDRCSYCGGMVGAHKGDCPLAQSYYHCPTEPDRDSRLWELFVAFCIEHRRLDESSHPTKIGNWALGDATECLAVWELRNEEGK